MHRQPESTLASEIADSFRAATDTLESYRAALARITPLAGASFASVFLRDEDDPELLRLACAQNWPQSSARYLGALRIRRGRGPTGAAVASGRPVSVPDIFEDPSLEEWWEPARELGFVAMASLPLPGQDRVVGAVSLYFRERVDFERSRPFLGAIAHRLAS